MAENMKLLLYLNEMMSGLKINFGKKWYYSNSWGWNQELDLCGNLQLPNCHVSHKVLGVTVIPSKLNASVWLPLEEKNGESWLLGKEAPCPLQVEWYWLILAYQAPLYTTFLCIFFPKPRLKSLINREGPFIFWQVNGLKKKYHLVKWGRICNSKKYGVLVLRTLEGLEKLWLSKNNVEMPYISEWRKYMIFAGTKIYQYTLVVSIFFLRHS